MIRKKRKIQKSFPEGRKPSLPKECEDELALCLKAKARWGFGSTRDEVRDLVKEYVTKNKDTETDLRKHCLYLRNSLYLRKYCQFKNNKPGEDWLVGFMRRYRLSSKKPSTLEKTRKIAASDPEIIYGYFDLLEEEVKRLNLTGRPMCVWNLDETNVCVDAKTTKIVAPKGEKAARVTATSGRENHTVMTAVSADGDVYPPLIVFKGVYMMSSWKAQTVYPGTEIAASENGWMTSAIFFNWLQRFCKTITQRPLLLIYDGHSTHLIYDVIKLAREEMMSIIKLPPHTTDKLQPLDVSCFKPFKSLWEKTIAKWTAENGGRKITKLNLFR